MNKEQIKNAREEYQYLQFVEFSNLGFWDRAIKQSHNKERNEKGFVSFSQAISKSDVIEKVALEKDKKYKILGVRVYGKGVFISREANGDSLITKTTKHYYRAKKDHLFWCKVDTKNGAFGITKQGHENCFASNNMEFAKINTSRANVEYLQLLFKDLKFQNYLDSFAVGTTNRRYIKFNELLNIQIPLPPLEKQQELVVKYNKKTLEAEAKEQKANQLEKSIDEYLIEELGIELPEAEQNHDGFLKFVDFKNLSRWDVDFFKKSNSSHTSRFSIIELGHLISTLRNGIAGRNFSEEGLEYLRVGNIRDNKIIDKDLKYTKVYTTNDILKKNTLLITRKGTVGESTIVKFNNKFVASSEIFIIHLLDKVGDFEINPNYISYVNSSSFVQNQYKEKSTGAFMPSLSQEKLKSLLFPLPPLPIQNKIADKISSIKQEIKTLRSEAENLKTQAKTEFENEVFN